MHVLKLITNNSIENQLVMIFLHHRCYCNVGIPRIVSAKYEVILCLATMFFFVRQGSSRRRKQRKKTLKT